MEQVFLDSFDPVGQVPLSEKSEDKQKKQKRPPNAFIRFCLEKRKEFREANPDKTNIEVSTLLANEWKQMTEEQKASYRTAAKDEQKKFKEENPEYGYDRAKQRRSTKKPSDYDPKQRPDIPDIVTLVNMPQDQLRSCLDELKAHIIVSYQGLQQILQQENNFQTMDMPFHESFSTNQ